MSSPKKTESYTEDTQETYYEGSNKEETLNATQDTSLNESQDFRLVDSEGDESMMMRTASLKDGQDICRKLVEQPALQQTSGTTQSKTDDELITTSDKENKIAVDEEVAESEPKKTEENVTSDIQDSEKKTELSDNDEEEVIHGTPPHSYTPSKKAVSDIEGASLKRKLGSFDEEPPVKVVRTTSREDAVSSKIQPDEEESRHSCKSDGSCEDLFRNIQRNNVVIEETQDPGDELTQGSPKSPAVQTETMENDDTQEYRSEQISQQQDTVFPEKCDTEKDGSLNVSAKLTDTSANDSTVVNVNSPHESDAQINESNLSVEAKTDVISSSNIIIDEKSETDILIETDASVKATDVVSDGSKQVEQTEFVAPKKIADNDEGISSSQGKVSDESSAKTPSSSYKSRISVELIYDGVKTSKSKPEIVEIDEDGEKIILDSSAEIDDQRTNRIAVRESKPNPEVVEINDSHENGERIVLDSLGTSSEVTTVNCGGRNDGTKNEMYKSCYETKSSDFSYKTMESTKESSLDSKTDRLVNGNSEKKSDTDRTLSVESDTFSGCDISVGRSDSNLRKLGAKANYFRPKDLDNIELTSISDHEHDADDSARNKSDLVHNSAKTIHVEREIGMYVRLRCLLQVDEGTKEFLGKELTAVHCEPVAIESTSAKQKNDDTASSSLADISDNKESSPGSVNSNIQLYHLNPSRLSIMSSISSSSSASSAASLAAKLALKDVHFSLPRGPAKHAKKPLSQDTLLSSSLGDKQILEESYERLTREWSNNRLLTTTILTCANAELSTFDAYNISNERLDDHLQKMHSSTPEVLPAKTELTATPKNTRKGKAVKRHRSKPTKSSPQTNGEDDSGMVDTLNAAPNLRDTATENGSTPSKKKIKLEVGITTSSAKLLIRDTDVLANSSPLPINDLVGRDVFAKWSDNNYYPGTITDRVKTKYKVSFYDGKIKTLIPEFVVPIPKTLKGGMSVYATMRPDDYGSCGIIVDVQNVKDGDTCYTVETDEGEHLRVQVKNIFLSADQAQLLKEEADTENSNIMPSLSTPKHHAQVSLDNMVDGKRRSKRIGTPVFSTPRSRSAVSSGSSASKTKSEPSVSGMSGKLKKEQSALLENESSDSNVESIVQDESNLRGVQKEIIGTPHEQIVKGPQSRIKGKPRVKKRTEDERVIAMLGPIPPANSSIFKGMSFILACTSLDSLDRYQDKRTVTFCTEVETETDNETENEDEWTERPFVRDRLQRQIIAGGGTVYEDFNEIPEEEYRNTKLITNVPNTSAKSILCLSVGIPPYNHKWIIRCCTEGKLVNPAEEALPTGWSLQKRAYVEMFQAAGNKPLSEVVVIIPSLTYDTQFATFWRQVCENAGAVVLIAENSGNMEAMDFDSEVVVVSNRRCPLWAVDRANQVRIPILSTTWVVQCLIEGIFCPYDDHSRYKYNHTN